MSYIEILLIIVLGINAGMDIYKKRISIVGTGIGIIGIIIGVVLKCIELNPQMLLGAIVGIIFIVMNLLLNINIGVGDGILITILGISIGFWGVMMTTIYALMLAAVAGVLIIKLKHKSKKYEIPFVPFLLMGYCLECML